MIDISDGETLNKHGCLVLAVGQIGCGLCMLIMYFTHSVNIGIIAMVGCGLSFSALMAVPFGV